MANRRTRYPKGTWMKLQSKETLLALMRQRDFSYERLARYAGCSKSFISHLVKGRKNTCTPDLADRLAEALSVPTEILFMPSQSADSGQNTRDRRMAS